MPTPSQGTIGSLDYPAEERKKLAKKSVHFTCPDCCPGSTADLLRSKEEADNNSTAAEAKEIIKSMSLKASSNEPTDKSNQESEEDKYKKARKLYSIRMQNIIKKRLNQSGTPSEVTPTPASPSANESSIPQRSSSRQSRPVQDRAQQQNLTETRSLFYDVIIALVVAVIAFLLYRRISMFSASSSDSITPPPPGPQQ